MSVHSKAASHVWPAPHVASGSAEVPLLPGMLLALSRREMLRHGLNGAIAPAFRAHPGTASTTGSSDTVAVSAATRAAKLGVVVFRWLTRLGGRLL